MAGSANIAARKTLTANIIITTIKGRNDRKDRRWRGGSMNHIGGGSSAPAVIFPKI
jgi:hypothetical protein